MRIRKSSSILAVCLVLGAWGGAEGAETAAFLKLSPGARPIGMGNAFTAIADDLNALVWNPAGLSSIKRPEASFMHAQLYADTSYDFIGYAHPLGHHSGKGAIHAAPSTVAFGVSRLSQAPIPGRDQSRGATGSFEASDMAVSAAYSRRVSRKTSVGATVKYLRSELAGETATGFAFDLGVRRAVSAGRRSITLAASALNLGPGLRYLDETNDLPLTFSAGVGVPLFSTILLAADFRIRPHEGESSVSLGSEFAVLPSLTLRAGYGSVFSSSQGVAGGSGIPLGDFGMGMGLKIGRGTVNYSFAPAGELGSAQRISLTTRF